MKKMFIILPACFIFIVFLIAFGYYSLAFNRINNLFKAANNGVDVGFHGNDFISEQDFNLMHSVNFIDQDIDYYVNGGTFIGVQKISVSEISFSCTSNYTAINAQSQEKIQKVTNQKSIVTMKFKNLKSNWIVTSVEVQGEV